MTDSESDTPAVVAGPLEAETEAALDAATHLTENDRGTVQALRVLARKIDQDEARWEYALACAAEFKTRPPATDNVSLPTFLRYAEALGLTPSGRVKLGPPKEAAGGKLAQLRSVAKPA